MRQVGRWQRAPRPSISMGGGVERVVKMGGRGEDAHRGSGEGVYMVA